MNNGAFGKASQYSNAAIELASTPRKLPLYQLLIPPLPNDDRVEPAGTLSKCLPQLRRNPEAAELR